MPSTWSGTVKARRPRRDAHAPELFAGLCGMTFTNIQLDDSVPVLGRLLGRFEVDGTEELERAKIAAAHVGHGDGVQSATAGGERLQNDHRRWRHEGLDGECGEDTQLQREDEMGADVEASGNGNDRGSKGIIIQRSRR
jgi:hypothetical protein